MKYLKFILFSLIDSIICIVIIENIHLSNEKIELIVKLICFVIIYFAIYGIKYIKDGKQILDK